MWKRCMGAMVVFSIAAAASAVPIEGPNGHFYERVTEPVTEWHFAESQAEAQTYLGTAGHLATITSAEEDDFIVANILPPSGLGEFVFVGGFQDPGSPEPGGGWQWVTGEEWDYTHWNPGEPNNNGGAEDFLIYVGHPSVWGWNDYTSDGAGITGYVVEYPVPEPATLGLLVVGGLGVLLKRRRKR